jgi:hypothetical protein
VRRGRTLATLGFAGVLVVAACVRLGGLRPRFGPLPGSVALELATQPETVIEAAAREVQAVGLTVAVADPAEGYLETAWYDVRRRATVTERARDLDQVVRLRFFADPLAGRTRLAAECVRRIAEDPSEPERDLERMVPDSSPGRVLLDSIVGRLKTAYPPTAPLPPASSAGSPP